MPGRPCTGNPNHSGTVTMPCSNTWLLCLLANFQQQHKVERGKNSGEKVEEESKRQGGGKKGENCRLFSLPCRLYSMFLSACSKIPSRAGHSAMSSPYPNLVRSVLFSSAGRTGFFSQNNTDFFFALSFDKEHCSGDAKSRLGSYKVKRGGGGTVHSCNLHSGNSQPAVCGRCAYFFFIKYVRHCESILSRLDNLCIIFLVLQ